MGQTPVTSPVRCPVNGIYLTQSLLKQWTTTQEPPDALFPNINIYRSRILYNTMTHQYLQEYNLHFSSEEEFLKYTSILDWRLSLDKNSEKFINKSQQRGPESDKEQRLKIQGQGTQLLERVRFFMDTSASELCSTVHSCSIYFNKMEMRLKQINDIPFRDILYMYEAAFQGFGTLRAKFGHFKVKQEMIFINKEGKMTVWVHPNPSNHSPSLLFEERRHKSKHKYDSRQIQDGEMIIDIMKIIQDNVDSDEYSMGKFTLFSEYLTTKICPKECRLLTKKSPNYHSLPSMSQQFTLLQSKIEYQPKCLTFTLALEYLSQYFQELGHAPSHRIQSVFYLFEQQREMQNRYFNDENDINGFSGEKTKDAYSNSNQMVKGMSNSEEPHSRVIDYEENRKISEYRLGDQLNCLRDRKKSKSPASASSNVSHNVSKYGIKIREIYDPSMNSRRVNTQYQIMGEYNFFASPGHAQNLRQNKKETARQKRGRFSGYKADFEKEETPFRSYRHNDYMAHQPDESRKNLSIKSNGVNDVNNFQSVTASARKFYTKPSTPMLNKSGKQKPILTMNQPHLSHQPYFTTNQVFFQPMNLPLASYQKEQLNKVVTKNQGKKQKHKKNNTDYSIQRQLRERGRHESIKANEKLKTAELKTRTRLKQEIQKYKSSNNSRNSNNSNNLFKQSALELRNNYIRTANRENGDKKQESNKPENKHTPKISFYFSNLQPRNAPQPNKHNKPIQQITHHCQTYQPPKNSQTKTQIPPSKLQQMHIIGNRLNIKYYTSNDSYELDKQIADDLEKMLQNPGEQA